MGLSRYGAAYPGMLRMRALAGAGFGNVLYSVRGIRELSYQLPSRCVPEGDRTCFREIGLHEV
jgi:hypothetical protein